MVKWEHVVQVGGEPDSGGSASKQLCDLGKVTFFSVLAFLVCKMKVACSQPNIYLVPSMPQRSGRCGGANSRKGDGWGDRQKQALPM